MQFVCTEKNIKLKLALNIITGNRTICISDEEIHYAYEHTALHPNTSHDVNSVTVIWLSLISSETSSANSYSKYEHKEHISKLL